MDDTNDVAEETINIAEEIIKDNTHNFSNPADLSIDLDIASTAQHRSVRVSENRANEVNNFEKREKISKENKNTKKRKISGSSVNTGPSNEAKYECEYLSFGTSVGLQLKKLPQLYAVEGIAKIQNILTELKIKAIHSANATSTSQPPTNHHIRIPAVRTATLVKPLLNSTLKLVNSGNLVKTTQTNQLQKSKPAFQNDEPSAFISGMRPSAPIIINDDEDDNI